MLFSKNKEKPLMKTIAIANASGGRGKTEVTRRLASSLTDRHLKSVLIVDLDPLAGISSRFLSQGETILAALMDPHVAPQAVTLRLSLFVGDETLNQADIWLVQQYNPDGVLRAFFTTWDKARQYDFCLIDCGPGLSVLTRNALVMADRVIVPQWVSRSANSDIAEYKVSETVREVQRLRAEQALPEKHISSIIRKPLDIFSEADWQALTTRVMA
jgi:cellulose biosynthesis protein BcsQ